MTERNAGLRSVLLRPAVYDTFQRAVGSRKVQRVVVEHLRPRRGQRVLDIGCGPGDLLDALPDVDYTGFDVSERYVEAARARFGDRGRFFVGDVAQVDVSSLGRYDRVIALGVLHHLDDAAASRLLALAARVLNGEGKLVTIDPCFTDRQSRLSRYVVGRDRGANVRTVAQYRALAEASFADVATREYHDLLRIPYSHCVLDCRATRR